MDMVLVEWEDSFASLAMWEDKDDLPLLKPSLCRSVGFIEHQDKKYTTLVMTDSKAQVLGRLTIPAGAIRSVAVLRKR